MATPLIQLALDSLDYDTTVNLAKVAHRYVDIIEIGTPCLKVNGLALVKDLKARFPTKQILVDLKTMDAGYYEAEPFFAAGAAITTVLGTSDLDTIKGVIAVANKYGAKAQVDLINVQDKAAAFAQAALSWTLIRSTWAFAWYLLATAMTPLMVSRSEVPSTVVMAAPALKNGSAS